MERRSATSDSWVIAENWWPELTFTRSASTHISVCAAHTRAQATRPISARASHAGSRKSFAGRKFRSTALCVGVPRGGRGGRDPHRRPGHAGNVGGAGARSMSTNSMRIAIENDLFRFSRAPSQLCLLFIFAPQPRGQLMMPATGLRFTVGELFVKFCPGDYSKFAAAMHQGWRSEWASRPTRPPPLQWCLRRRHLAFRG